MDFNKARLLYLIVFFLYQFLDGSEDGIRAACTKGRMIREMAHQL